MLIKLIRILLYFSQQRLEHNNFSLADEDVGWIRIPALVANDINSFVAWVDYVPNKGIERNRNEKNRGKKQEILREKVIHNLKFQDF